MVELDDDDDGAEGGAPVPIGARRRRRQALVVVGCAVASAVAGVAIGSRLKSPADAANARKAPPPSLITVPVEKRALVSNLTVAGEVVYDQPTPVRLLGAVGESAGSNQVITRLPEFGAAVNEGDVLLEVSGRPVFAFQGPLPVFRALEPGANGPDVQQLEAALERLGFSPGTVDEIYDEGTEKALDALYESRNHISEGPSDEQRKQLRDVRTRLTEAEETLRKAETDLREGGSTASDADLLAGRQSVERAQEAVPEAEAAAAQGNQTAASNVNAAIALRDATRLTRDSARTIAEAAAQPGAINADSGEPYSPIEVAELQATLAAAERDLIQDDQAITAAVAEQSTTKTSGDRSIDAARDELELARARLAEMQKPADTAPLQAAVDQARVARDQAVTDVYVLEAAVGTKMPAGEFVFLPTVPTQVTEISAAVGANVGETLLTVSSAATQITGRVSKNDGDLLAVGATVTIEIPDAGVESTGTLAQIGAKQSADTGDGFSGGGGDSSRLDVVVTPDDAAALKDFVGYSARIRISVSSTDGEVLAVPVAALTVGPDGSSRVEVLRSQTTSPSTDGDDSSSVTDAASATTDVVIVEVGLTAQGYAEISTPGNILAEGDRVVVGVEETDEDTADRASSGGDADDSGDNPDGSIESGNPDGSGDNSDGSGNADGSGNDDESGSDDAAAGG